MYLTVEDHPLFKREGQDIICDVPISFVQAALGAEIEVPTLTGAQSSRSRRAPSRAMFSGSGERDFPICAAPARGDQLCRIAVEVPSKLTSKQKELLQEFERLSADNTHPITKGFFDKVKEVFGDKEKK